MKSYRRKTKIHTIVLGKKRTYDLLCLCFCIIISLGLMLCNIDINSSIHKKTYNILRSAIELIHGDIALSDLNLPRPGVDTIMKYTSAIFLHPDTQTEAAPQNTDKNEESVSAAARITEAHAPSKATDIKNETDYQIDTQALLDTPKSYNASAADKRVLILHTHACETYSGSNGLGLGSNGTYRTRDADKNMIKIGSEVAGILKKAGINVIHDTTLCDYPSYNSSYVKSLGIIEWYQERYEGIDFIFDIHRDAITEADGTPKKLCTEIDGKKTAQVMIVCGTDAMGLENPKWQENLTLALKLNKNLNEMYPGLMRPINLRRERFNMHKSTGSLLFEIGSHANSIDEAINAARLLADGIVKTISSNFS